MQSTQLESPQETAPIKDLVRKSEIRERLGSLDAFRGTIMLLMLNEATRLPLVAARFLTARYGRSSHTTPSMSNGKVVLSMT